MLWPLTPSTIFTSLLVDAASLLRSLLNQSLDAELVLGIHHLVRAWETQIVGQLRGCDRQVHGVTVVGPLGTVFAGDETNPALVPGFQVSASFTTAVGR